MYSPYFVLEPKNTSVILSNEKEKNTASQKTSKVIHLFI